MFSTDFLQVIWRAQRNKCAIWKFVIF